MLSLTPVGSNTSDFATEGKDENYQWCTDNFGKNVKIYKASRNKLKRRKAKQSTDGARGNQGFKAGKHEFVFIFNDKPWGSHCNVGLCTEDTELWAKGYEDLLGCDDTSFGWNVGQRRINQVWEEEDQAVRYPEVRDSEIPKTIHMIVDFETGSASFCAGGKDFGVAFKNLPKNTEFFPAVCVVYAKTEVTIKHYFMDKKARTSASAVNTTPLSVQPVPGTSKAKTNGSKTNAVVHQPKTIFTSLENLKQQRKKASDKRDKIEVATKSNPDLVQAISGDSDAVQTTSGDSDAVQTISGDSEAVQAISETNTKSHNLEPETDTNKQSKELPPLENNFLDNWDIQLAHAWKYWPKEFRYDYGIQLLPNDPTSARLWQGKSGNSDYWKKGKHQMAICRQKLSHGLHVFEFEMLMEFNYAREKLPEEPRDTYHPTLNSIILGICHSSGSLTESFFTENEQKPVGWDLETRKIISSAKCRIPSKNNVPEKDGVTKTDYPLSEEFIEKANTKVDFNLSWMLLDGVQMWINMTERTVSFGQNGLDLGVALTFPEGHDVWPTVWMGKNTIPPIRIKYISGPQDHVDEVLSDFNSKSPDNNAATRGMVYDFYDDNPKCDGARVDKFITWSSMYKTAHLELQGPTEQGVSTAMIDYCMGTTVSKTIAPKPGKYKPQVAIGYWNTPLSVLSGSNMHLFALELVKEEKASEEEIHYVYGICLARRDRCPLPPSDDDDNPPDVKPTHANLASVLGDDFKSYAWDTKTKKLYHNGVFRGNYPVGFPDFSLENYKRILFYKGTTHNRYRASKDECESMNHHAEFGFAGEKEDGSLDYFGVAFSGFYPYVTWLPCVGFVKGHIPVEIQYRRGEEGFIELLDPPFSFRKSFLAPLGMCFPCIDSDGECGKCGDCDSCGNCDCDCDCCKRTCIAPLSCCCPCVDSDGDCCYGARGNCDCDCGGCKRILIGKPFSCCCPCVDSDGDCCYGPHGNCDVCGYSS